MCQAVDFLRCEPWFDFLWSSPPEKLEINVVVFDRSNGRIVEDVMGGIVKS